MLFIIFYIYSITNYKLMIIIVYLFRFIFHSREFSAQHIYYVTKKEIQE